MSEPQTSDPAITAWIALLRAHNVALGTVQRALSTAGMPPLEWYDVLWELERSRAPLRPRVLQARLLLAQYNLSRLIERMARAGLVTRAPCPQDGRGQLVALTPAGAALRQRMWAVYGAAIARVMGDSLDADETAALARLLRRLAPPHMAKENGNRKVRQIRNTDDE